MSIHETISADGQDQNDLQELASLARLMTFALQSAKECNANYPAYFIEMALGAILEKISTSAFVSPLAYHLDEYDDRPLGLAH